MSDKKEVKKFVVHVHKAFNDDTGKFTQNIHVPFHVKKIKCKYSSFFDDGTTPLMLVRSDILDKSDRILCPLVDSIAVATHDLEYDVDKSVSGQFTFEILMTTGLLSTTTNGSEFSIGLEFSG